MDKGDNESELKGRKCYELKTSEETTHLEEVRV